MMTKPRVRVQAGDSSGATARYTVDGYQNYEARVGLGTDNISGGASTNSFGSFNYGLNPITRNRMQLEFAYRGSWICREVVDAVADDMTREGIDFTGEITKKPDRMEELQADMVAMQIMPNLNTTTKWARLYGGSLGVLLIDGQQLDTPLRPETVGKGQFKGILPMERWLVRPARESLIMDYGPTMGLPSYYQVVAHYGALPVGNIDASRVIRMDGVKMPFYQTINEYGWSVSVLEPLWDRLVAFDSATLGAAQLCYKAYIRVMKINGLRNIIAQGGPTLKALGHQLEFIRKYQSNEGLTVIDSGDEFESLSYTFTGISDIIDRLAHQLCGAARIPYTRLFGESPGGLNSSGDGELANYYDRCHADQEKDLRPGLGLVTNLMYRSRFGEEPPADFGFDFQPLYQESPSEKASTALAITQCVSTAFQAGITDRGTSLKELKASSEETGVWASIEDEQITEAEEEGPPDPFGDQMEMMEKQGEIDKKNAKAAGPPKPGGGKPKKSSGKSKDSGLQDELSESSEVKTDTDNLLAIAEEGRV